MCTTSLRGITWRAALAGLGSVGLAVCMHAAPVSYLDASANDDAFSLMLTIFERYVPNAVDCVFHKSSSDDQPDGFSACTEWVLHATTTLVSDNGAGRQLTDAPFDSHAR